MVTPSTHLDLMYQLYHHYFNRISLAGHQSHKHLVIDNLLYII
jgi:hypothetical protein